MSVKFLDIARLAGERQEHTHPCMPDSIASLLAHRRAWMTPSWRVVDSSSGTPVLVPSTRSSPASKSTRSQRREMISRRRMPV